MIRGYPAEPSVLAGGTLTLHVATDAPQFRVELFRQGERLVLQHRSGWLDGRRAPPHLPYQDWGVDATGMRGEHLPAWPPYALPIPAGWRSGAYIAMLVEGDGRGHVAGSPDSASPDGREARALFVVRPGGARAPILYKLPLLTYHAYNQAVPEPFDPAKQRGGWCLYTVPDPGHLARPVPPAVCVRRPGGGTGGTPWDVGNADPFDPTPRQTFVHWDAPFIDYCTDLDVHRDAGGDLLRGPDLLLCAGHDEYWSDAMRAHVRSFIRGGRNVAFLSGNTCWYRVAFDDACTFRRLHPWSDPAAPGGPENGLTGVSYRNAGERGPHDSLAPVGYRVQHAGHWVYEGTGLRDGDTFGEDQHLAGYECDGAEFDRRDLEAGRPARPTGRDGTPTTFVILAVADLSVAGWGLGNRAATMGAYRDGGTVFTASTTDWPRVVASGRAPAVEQITRNVLDRLGAAPGQG
jgi:hypothetical protein